MQPTRNGDESFPLEIHDTSDAVKATVKRTQLQKEIDLYQRAIDTVLLWHTVSEKKLAKQFMLHVPSLHPGTLLKPNENESVEHYRKRLKQEIKAKIKSLRKKYRFFVPKESLEKFTKEYLKLYSGINIVMSRENVQKFMRDLLMEHFNEETIATLEKNAIAAKELG